MKKFKITLLTGIGSGLEHYDYVLCSMFASFISYNFFPNSNHVTSLFTTFGILAVSNIIRPFGATIFGFFGDKLGRKNIFVHTLLWMALLTFIIGLIPSFASVGLIATVLFSICRILQGSIFGAEVPGAVTLLAEHTEDKHHGLHFGLVSAIIGVGILLGSFITWVITKILSESQMLSWGFRVPFLLGGVLALLGFFIRKHITETPKFLALQKNKIKISWTIVKEHWQQAVKVIGVLIFPAAWITLQLVFPTFLHEFYHFNLTDIYLAMTYGYIMSTIMIPIFGWLSDIVGRKILIIIAELITIIFIYPIFMLLQTEARWVVFAFYIFTQTIAAILTPNYFILLPQAFKTVIRYTGTAFSFNIAFALVSLFPMVINYVYGVSKTPIYLVIILMALASLSIISTIALKTNLQDD